MLKPPRKRKQKTWVRTEEDATGPRTKQEATGETEIKIKGSRFVGQAFGVTSEDAARVHLGEVRKRHHDARHHCSAWTIGPGLGEPRTEIDSVEALGVCAGPGQDRGVQVEHAERSVESTRASSGLSIDAWNPDASFEVGSLHASPRSVVGAVVGGSAVVAEEDGVGVGEDRGGRHGGVRRVAGIRHGAPRARSDE